MTLATLLLIAALVIMALVVLWYFLKNWVIELNPLQWIATVLLSFAAGAELVAFVDNDGIIELLAALPVILIIAWFAISAGIRAAIGGGGKSAAAPSEE